jgi:hypothetical protein
MRKIACLKLPASGDMHAFCEDRHFRTYLIFHFFDDVGNESGQEYRLIPGAAPILLQGSKVFI